MCWLCVKGIECACAVADSSDDDLVVVEDERPEPGPSGSRMNGGLDPMYGGSLEDRQTSCSCCFSKADLKNIRADRSFHLGNALELLRHYYNIKRGLVSASVFAVLYALMCGTNCPGLAASLLGSFLHCNGPGSARRPNTGT